jgi:hypothetical protein
MGEDGSAARLIWFAVAKDRKDRSSKKPSRLAELFAFEVQCDYGVTDCTAWLP